MEQHDKALIRQAFVQPEIVEQNSLFGNPFQGGGSLPSPTNFFPTGLPGGDYPGGYPGGGFPGGYPAAPTQQTTSSGGGGLANLPLKDIKGFIDRMGGIDGILATMTKMQKVFSNVQQMAPMLKLLVGSFMKTKNNDGEFKNDFRRKRRRSRGKRKKARISSVGKPKRTQKRK